MFVTRSAVCVYQSVYLLAVKMFTIFVALIGLMLIEKLNDYAPIEAIDYDLMFKIILCAAVNLHFIRQFREHFDFFANVVDRQQ